MVLEAACISGGVQPWHARGHSQLASPPASMASLTSFRQLRTILRSFLLFFTMFSHFSPFR
eukprot:9582595-Lingulodinium_polyedra.AAC.1